MWSHTPHADTRAAQAALARPSLSERVIDRFQVLDDTDEAATQILTVTCERPSSRRRDTFPEAQPCIPNPC